MNCATCNASVRAGSTACARCGAPLVAAAVPAAVPPDPVDDDRTTARSSVGLLASASAPEVARPAASESVQGWERGWHQRPGDPVGVQRWHTGTNWTDSLTGGSTADQASAERLVPGSANSAGKASGLGDIDMFRSGGRPATRVGVPTRLPGQVSAASVLEFIVGGVTIVGAVFFLALGSVIGAFAAIGILLLAIGGLQIWVGVALRQLRSWARIAAIVLALIGGVLSLISLLQGDVLSLLGLGIDVAIVILLGQRASVAAFDA